MQYCINALLKNNNEIMQYYIINNDIALIMHYHALLQMPDQHASVLNCMSVIIIPILYYILPNCKCTSFHLNSFPSYSISTAFVEFNRNC